jgi:aminodeoxyfutalosine deaminase
VDAGVIVTLNSDDPGMFGSDLAAEFELAERVFGLTQVQLAAIRQNAWDYRFKR